MSKLKTGFSTGKGYLEKVDKASGADNADNAEHTMFTNAAWKSYGLDTGYVELGKTYQFMYTFENQICQCIFTVASDTTSATKQYLPPSYCPNEILMPFLSMGEDPFGGLTRLTFDGILVNLQESFYDYVTDVKYRELK